MKKNLTVKIFAFLALFWILISIIWVWILFFMEWSNISQDQQVLTQEELQKMIEEWKLQINWSWAETLTWAESWIELKVWTSETQK